jgi:hypothetical protein
MRNVPHYLTTGGGLRPEWLLTRRQAYWARVTRTARAAEQHSLRVIDDETTTRLAALLSVLALIALALTVLVGQLEQASPMPAPTSPRTLSTTVGSSAAASPPAADPHATGVAPTGARSGARAVDGQSSSRPSSALSLAETARLAARTTPALVTITTALPDGSGEAGTVVRTSGLVLTAAHVVAGAVTLDAVDLGNGYDYPGTVIGIDPRHDIGDPAAGRVRAAHRPPR